MADARITVTWKLQAVLDALLSDPGREMSARQIAGHNPLAPPEARPATPQILEQLHQAGWAARREDPRRGRHRPRLLYRLTPHGMQQARAAAEEPATWPHNVVRIRYYPPEGTCGSISEIQVSMDVIGPDSTRFPLPTDWPSRTPQQRKAFVYDLIQDLMHSSLTEDGEYLPAPDAVWPPSDATPAWDMSDYPRRLMTYCLAVALHRQEPTSAANRLMDGGDLPGTRPTTAALALWMLGARPDSDVESAVRNLFA